MASGDDGTERWCVVTGGRGFAARHLVEKLISYNMFLVRIADMGPTISLDPHEENGTLGQALRSAQAVYVSMDLRNKAQVLKGTKNVIDACIELKMNQCPTRLRHERVRELSKRYGWDKKGAMKVLGEWSDRMGLWAMPAYFGVHTLTLALCLPYTVFMEATASLIFDFFHLNGLELSPCEGQLKDAR